MDRDENGLIRTYRFALLPRGAMTREGDTYTYTGPCNLELELHSDGHIRHYFRLLLLAPFCGPFHLLLFLKTGYLTLASLRTMFLNQAFGIAMGCIISRLIYSAFSEVYLIGDPEGPYLAPYAQVYRGIALLGAKGFDFLPKHCLELAIILFVSVVLINIVHDLLMHYETKYWIYRFIPNPMCLAIPFYLGGFFAIDICIGSLILYVWEKKNKPQSKDYAPAIASGLICGDSLWGVPAAALSLKEISPPICMKFLSASMNRKVDNFLSGAH